MDSPRTEAAKDRIRRSLGLYWAAGAAWEEGPAGIGFYLHLASGEDRYIPDPPGVVGGHEQLRGLFVEIWATEVPADA